MNEESLLARAKHEITISHPYFLLLSKKNIKSIFRKQIVNNLPTEFFSIFTQISRHFVNNSLCNTSSIKCKKVYRILIKFSDTSTTFIVKKKLLNLLPFDTINLIYSTFLRRIKNDNSEEDVCSSV